MSGRWLTNAAGLAGRGAGVECMGCATAGPAFVGLCRTQETTSRAVPAQEYAECSEEHTVNASASVHIHFRTHEPAPCCDSHQLPGQCGKQCPRVRALHRLGPRHSSERYQCNFLAALGADVGTASHRPSQQLIFRGRSPIPAKWDILSETNSYRFPVRGQPPRRGPSSVVRALTGGANGLNR